MQLTQDELSLDRINEALERGEDVVIKARKKVGPMDGPFKLLNYGSIECTPFTPDSVSDMGLAFNTLKQAETAKPIIRRYARLLNWVLANCPGHDPSGEGAALMFDKFGGKWGCIYSNNLGGLNVTMPTDKYQELRELLNSGAYTL